MVKLYNKMRHVIYVECMTLRVIFGYVNSVFRISPSHFVYFLILRAALEHRLCVCVWHFFVP